MDAATLGIVPMLIILAICWKVGLINSLQQITKAANNEIGVQVMTHTTTVVKRAAELPDLDEATLTRAKANVAALKDFQL